jgi:leucyl aminopeptidase
MMAMKSDMAGAAAALATISALPQLGVQVKVSVLMMCAENALSGTSQRPSDVIKHYGGKTVEVINTDAEGRLVLADGLAFADINLDPDYVVDIATLTGAATLGLGRQYAAMYTRYSWMANQARAIASEHGLQINVLSGSALKEFGGLRAVGNSSPNPGPRFIHLTYTPKGGKKAARIPHVVLVGKGITFDTGGISLKRPYDTMMAMKSDMAGAAAALATISALPQLGVQVKVSVLMMCAENALSGTSQRPSDVIKHYGGKTVEVINTDAEGRLVLADGLAFADINLDPDYVVDIATLTGAATLGLGRQYAAMYTRNSQLARTL